MIAPAEVRRLAIEHRFALVGLSLALAVVVAGKRLYADAGADQLDPILRPTAALVGLVTGGDFVREAGVGWVDRAARFTIAPACAGVSFALAAFLALSLGWSSGMRTAGAVVGRLAAAAALAAGATLAVNTARIVLAIELHSGDLTPAAIGLDGLDPGERHRALGIAVYLGGLVALYGLAAPRRRLAWAGVPIAAYLTLTLALPALNGAAARPGFAGHAAWILAGCALVGAAAALGSLCTGMRRNGVARRPAAVEAGGRGGSASWRLPVPASVPSPHPLRPCPTGRSAP